MTDKVPFIFDKTFKRIITLSSKAVLNLINELFGTHYPEGSSITYNWTEYENDSLKKTLADTILTINHSHSYHLEAQMTNDTDIVFRIFEYGFNHANRTHCLDKDLRLLQFPEPKIIYLYSETEIPEKYTLRLQFEKQKYFDYEVSTINLQNISVEELNQRKLILLIPFQLLKMRKLIAKSRSPETISQLQKLLYHDILGSIRRNIKSGDITQDDAVRLQKLTGLLLRDLYEQYEETKEVCDMYDQSLILDVDIYIEERDQLQAQIMKLDEELSQKSAQLSQQSEQLSQQSEQLSQQSEQLSQQAKRIAELEAALAKRN